MPIILDFIMVEVEEWHWGKSCKRFSHLKFVNKWTEKQTICLSSITQLEKLRSTLRILPHFSLPAWHISMSSYVFAWMIGKTWSCSPVYSPRQVTLQVFYQDLGLPFRSSQCRNFGFILCLRWFGSLSCWLLKSLISPGLYCTRQNTPLIFNP